LLSATFMATSLMAQEVTLSKPGAKTIELLEEIGKAEKAVVNSTRQPLLSSSNRVGFGAETTGGTNEVFVKNIAEFVAAVAVSNNYIRLASSLSGQDLLVSGSINITGENITIDGSDAPGAVFRPAANYPNNQPMMISKGANIIINEITLDGGWYPERSTYNNVAAIRMFGDGIWVNKVTVTGFWDDAFDIVISATNATFSNVKTFNTNKSMHFFYPKSSERHVSIHSSELSARERNPWNQGSKNVHMWNNYIHDDPSFPYYAGTYVGNTKEGYASNRMNRSDPAYTISEHNVFEGPNAFLIFAEGPPSIPGFVHSNNDFLGGGKVEGGGTANGVSNYTATSTPSLFDIPYFYNLLPTEQVKDYVLANAGASL